MNNEEYHLLLYQRVKEIQPHLAMLAQDFKSMGMTNEEINTEICFAIMHEGYRLRYLEQEISLKPNSRKLQTYVPEKKPDNKSYVIVTNSNVFWKQKAEELCKSNGSDLVVDNRYFIEFENGMRIKKINPLYLDENCCSCQFNVVIVDENVTLTDEQKLTLKTHTYTNENNMEKLDSKTCGD